MKREMLSILFLSASVTALAQTQEVQLGSTKIHGGGKDSGYHGSVIQNEKKNVVIITKADIEKKNYKDLESIFKDSPVTTVVYTEAGPLVTLRGSGQKTAMRVKVLLDGDSINTVDDSMGVIPFNAIPVSSIEKIEIIPGGGITLYGSGASSGVINIVTSGAKTKDYGNVSFTASSFQTYNTAVNKGIALGEKVFLNLGVEAQTGKGYRDKEESKKLNILSGIEYKINDKNKIKFHGTKYIADADGSDELDLISLKTNRRGAGPSDANVKSDRYSYSVDYEYRPTENVTVTSSWNQSRFKRDFKQYNRPYLTFLPSEWIEDFFGVPEGWNADMVIKNAHNRMTGTIEEKIKNGKIKTDWTYKQGKGKLIFGYDYTDHELKRQMDVRVDSFNPIDSTALFLRKKEDRIINEEILKEHPENLISFFTSALSFLMLSPNIEESGIDYAKLSKKSDELYYKYSPSEEDKKKYEAGEEHPWGYYTTVKPIMWRVLYDINQEKIKDYIKDGKDYIVVKEDPNDPGSPIKNIPITNQKFEDWLMLNYPSLYDETFSMTPVTTARVDVKKEVNSFYLFHDYKLTDRLEMNAGLRYEKAAYKGTRYTRTEQFIKGNPEKELAKQMIDMYTALSDVEYYKRSQGERHNWSGNDTATEKLKELKETGSTSILMSELTRKDKREEENLGGELGFNYRFNDTDTAYIKYERGFNTPLPTQLTNKTFDTRTKIKTYWESNLKTEKMDNIELGIRGAISDNITYSLSGFVSDTKNEILSIVKNGSSHMMREWRFVNIDKTRRMGLEFQSQQNFDKWTLKQSITYVDPKILSNDYEKQVHDIVNERGDELYRNYREVGKWRTKNFAFSNVKVPEEESIRLGEEANKILDGLYEGKKTMQETKKELQALIDASSYKDIFNNDEYFKRNGVISNTSLKRVQDLKTIIHKQFEEEVQTAVEGSYLKKGAKIPLSPKLKGTFSADYQFTEKLSLGTNVTYIGSFISAEPGKGYEIVTKKIPHHLVADVYGTYHINPDFAVKFEVNNVFNHKYYLREDTRTATPAPGITYSAGFSYRF